MGTRPELTNAGDFMLSFWGRDAAAVAAACPVPVMRDGDGSYYCWFDDAESRARFLQTIAGRTDWMVARDTADGPLSRLRTVAVVRFGFEGEVFQYPHDFGFGYHASAARRMFEEGNYSCDCNRSAYIAAHCREDFEELDCGNRIELLSLTIEFRQPDDPGL